MTTAPITMLPIRIETRLVGAQLYVRIYPDDLHIDHHDPRLTTAEAAAGKRYWTSAQAGDPLARQQLVKDVGPSRATWAREALTPSSPEVVIVDGNPGRPAVARALPSAFVVRVRYAGGEQTVQGAPVPSTLPIGPGLGTGNTSSTPAASATLVLDEGMRWMVDFEAAKEVGTGVVVSLPAGITEIQDVVVVGVPVDAATALTSLLSAHRFSDGAAFLAPGTPTNNLADSPSGYSFDDAPEPAPLAPPESGSAAAELAMALGLDPLSLAAIANGSRRDLDEARLMSRALFEATWGPFLRTQAQPGFDLAQLPEAHAHVTTYVRGGGPLPVLRLGRQPYAIAPVMARGTWAPLTEGPFVRWLSGFLPRIRPLWLSGVADAPAGPDLLAQEPVSTRVRLRTVHTHPTVAYMIAAGGATVHGDADAFRIAVASEIGFASATAAVFSQLYAQPTAELWLPMAVDGDTAFDLGAPAPKSATSVLGLLLRSAAETLAANATKAPIGRAAVEHPVAVSTEARFAALAPEVRTRLTDLARYDNSDALAEFGHALAALAPISTARRATLTGEILDCASHRYDAWVTSVATARLAGVRASQPTNLVGAWGAVVGVQRRADADATSGGFVVAPSPRQASTAGVLRAAWLAHGGDTNGATAPFAVDLAPAAARRALAIADGMRTGQQLGALLGYQLERGIQEAPHVEISWVIYELRAAYPLAIDTVDNAPQASAARMVIDGWKLAQVEISTPGAIVAAIPTQPAFGSLEQRALQLAIDDVVATIDAFADLGLAESMYQLSGANLERAAATSDMLGRATSPPDRFEVVSTPRGGRGIEQRLVVVFGGDERPSGYASDTPRAQLAPKADAFVARRLGPLDDIRIRLLDSLGTQLAAPLLSSLGLSALDLGALELASADVMTRDDERGTSNPGRQGVARLVAAAGVDGAVTVGFDPVTDGALLDLLDHATAWHRALANRRPLTAETFVARAQLVSGASTDPLDAARALVGGPAVVEGSVALPTEIQTCISDQAALLGSRKGAMTCWLQDSARVRPAAAALGEAMLQGDLAGRPALDAWAAQSPAAPYGDAAAKGWVGLPFPSALGDAPTTSVAIIGESVAGTVTGIELDAWTEVIPASSGNAAVTANLRAPSARAPNAILIAVPPDPRAAWTNASMFSVVDEALELAACRMVDLDATRRVPALLPAAYVAEYDPNGLDVRKLLGAAATFPSRWVAEPGE